MHGLSLIHISAVIMIISIGGAVGNGRRMRNSRNWRRHIILGEVAELTVDGLSSAEGRSGQVLRIHLVADVVTWCQKIVKMDS